MDWWLADVVSVEGGSITSSQATGFIRYRKQRGHSALEYDVKFNAISKKGSKTLRQRKRHTQDGSFSTSTWVFKEEYDLSRKGTKVKSEQSTVEMKEEDQIEAVLGHSSASQRHDQHANANGADSQSTAGNTTSTDVPPPSAIQQSTSINANYENVDKKETNNDVKV